MAAELNGMVLKCESTGKLFYSTKDAELHSEETGLKAFAQVSLEEKLWICKETGKVCFTEQQVDLHKRRVPEAQTFEEGTIADLKAKEADKAATEGPVEMETDEEALLRSAGMAGKMARLNKSSGGAGPSGPPVVTKETVDMLIDMGFTQLRAEKALVKTSNGGIEAAVNWLTEHLEDADIDEPLAEEVKQLTQEEVDAETAKAMGGGGGASSQLTPEEKKAKLEEALAKARAKKAGMSAEDMKAAEMARREDGHKSLKSKREQEDQQRKRDMEARQREKREFMEERQKLREKLAQDKAERAAKNPPKPAAAGRLRS